MSFDDLATYGTITGNLEQIIADFATLGVAVPEAIPTTGTIRFIPATNAVNTNASDPSVAFINEIDVDLDASGSFSATLVATDNTNFSPINWTYTIVFDIAGLSLPNAICYVPGGSTRDLHTIMPQIYDPSTGVVITKGDPGPAGPAGVNAPPNGTAVGIMPRNGSGGAGAVWDVDPTTAFAPHTTAVRKYDSGKGVKQVPRFKKLGPIFDTTGVAWNKMFWPSVQRRTPTVGDTNPHVVIYSTDHANDGIDGIYALTINLDAADPASTVHYYGKMFARGNYTYDLSADTQAANPHDGSTFSTAFGTQSETPTIIYNPDAVAKYAGDPVLSQPWWIFYQLKGRPGVGYTIAGQVTCLVTASDPIDKSTYKAFDARAINNNLSYAIMDYPTLAIITGGTHTGYRRIVRMGSTWFAPGNLGEGGRRSNFVSQDGLAWRWNMKMSYGQPDISIAGNALNFEDVVVWNGERWAVGRMRGNTPDVGVTLTTGWIVMGRPNHNFMEYAGAPEVVLTPANGSVTANGKTWTETTDIRNMTFFADDVTGKLWLLYQTDSLTMNLAVADPTLASDDTQVLPTQSVAQFPPYRDPTDGTLLDLSLDRKEIKSWGIWNDNVMPADFVACEGKDALAFAQVINPDSITPISTGPGEVMTTAQPPTAPAYQPHVVAYRAADTFNSIPQYGGVMFTARGFKYQTGVTGHDVGISICNQARTAGVTFQQRAYNPRVTTNRAITFTAATDTVSFASAHGRAVNDLISFGGMTGGAGITSGTSYYVRAVPSSTTLTLSTTPYGTLLDITSDGSATNFTVGDDATGDPEIRFHTPSGVDIIVPIPACPYQLLGSNTVAQNGMHTLSIMVDNLHDRVLVLDKDLNLIAWAPFKTQANVNRWHDDTTMYGAIWVRNNAADGTTTRWLKARGFEFRMWS